MNCRPCRLLALLLALAACGGDTRALDVAAGTAHSCAAVADGRAACWGANGSGQLGDDSLKGSIRPVEVDCLDGVVEVAAGEGHSCARLDDGTVWCWGKGEQGQLGNGASASSKVPVQAIGVSDAVSLTVGDRHSCAAQGDGSVRCWGDNASGQLGDGSVSARPTPVVVAAIGEAVMVAAALGIDGSAFSCARTRGGRVWCWGANDVGQLGGGSSSAIAPVAVEVPSLAEVSTLSLGAVHACAVAGGAVRCWGALGDPPGPLADVAIEAVATGALHSCALGADKRVRCWGNNDNGQLGGAVDPEKGFSVVEGVVSATAIAAGALHSCAAVSDGTLFCWGENNNGRLGDGTAGGIRGRPVAVTFEEL